jgi:hypothetical protein
MNSCSRRRVVAVLSVGSGGKNGTHTVFLWLHARCLNLDDVRSSRVPALRTGLLACRAPCNPAGHTGSQRAAGVCRRQLPGAWRGNKPAAQYLRSRQARFEVARASRHARDDQHRIHIRLEIRGKRRRNPRVDISRGKACHIPKWETALLLILNRGNDVLSFLSLPKLMVPVKAADPNGPITPNPKYGTSRLH